jgi:hypothetical protein
MTISPRGIARLLLLLALVVVTRSARAEDPAQPTRRIAVLVGANGAPPGGSSLRFAHTDAQQLADALVRVGHFAAADVHVLFDPEPAELTAALEASAQDVQAASGDALFLFYYSGHSDGQSLYPRGEAIPLGALRDRIEHIGARIRVGILDTCRGGSWTQAKGLTVGPALDPADLINVSTEGTALVSSSSGLENAHEADAVSGSFFTHHFTAGLLGAADRAGDGNITLEEAFDYAKERTVRDSARFASVPQHPSFDLQLRGRQDIVLTSVATSPSALEVTRTSASLEIIHLPSGVTIAEVPPSVRALRIAVPPGHYLVRSIVDDRVLSHELEIRPGETVSISSGQLEATGDARLAVKGDTPAARPSLDDRSTPAAYMGVVQLLAGESTFPTQSSTGIHGTTPGGIERQFSYGFSASYGITDRLAISVPGAFAYRFGTAGRLETILSGGMHELQIESIGVVGFFVGATLGIDVRIWTAPSQSLTVGTDVDCYKGTRSVDPDLVCDGRVRAAYSLNLGDVVTLHLAVAGVDQVSGVTTHPILNSDAFTVSIGGTSGLAFRQWPLFEAHISPRFSLDASGTWFYEPNSGVFGDEYLGGFTLTY